MQAQNSGCAICGQQKRNESGWFLLTESRWQDRITILQWHDQLSIQPGVQRVCSTLHAQELVVHWMTTGGLDYPFARTSDRGEDARRKKLVQENGAVELAGARQIGELAIHRESIQRILRESPHSLTAILDALLCALERNQVPSEAFIDVETEVLCGTGSGVA